MWALMPSCVSASVNQKDKTKACMFTMFLSNTEYITCACASLEQRRSLLASKASFLASESPNQPPVFLNTLLAHLTFTMAGKWGACRAWGLSERKREIVHQQRRQLIKCIHSCWHTCPPTIPRTYIKENMQCVKAKKGDTNMPMTHACTNTWTCLVMLWGFQILHLSGTMQTNIRIYFGMWWSGQM